MGRRSAAPNKLITTLTQGSQSLALGLTTSAASRLVLITHYSSPITALDLFTIYHSRVLRCLNIKVAIHLKRFNFF